jgi:hypothetical protein
MPVVPTIDVSVLRDFNRKLNSIDPELRKQVGKDIKGALKPQADQMKSRIPTQAPLSGMKNKGRLAWGKPESSVYASPGSGKGSIARIEIYASSTSKRAGFKMADLAGTKNDGERYNRGYMRSGSLGRRGAIVRPHPTRAGDALIANLKRRYPLSAGGRGGRFGWANFIETRPTLIANVMKILDKYASRVSREGL